MGYRETVLADRPFVFWALGDGSSTVPSPDLSGHGFNPTHNNVSYGKPGPFSQGVANGFVAGSTSYMRATGVTDPGDNMSYEIWVRRGATGVTASIMSTVTGGFFLRFNPDNTIHMLRSQVVDALSTSAAFSDTSKFYHIVSTNEATGGRRIWVNGEKKAEALGSSTGFSNGGNVYINVENDSGIFRDPATQTLWGYAAYKYALSPAQILQHYLIGSNLVLS